MNYYFYKCPNADRASGCDYYDHSHGIAGFKTQQKRDRYIGYMSENELEKQLKQRDQCSTGTRRKRVNVSKSYNSRF